MGGRVGLLGELEASLALRGGRVGRLGDPQGSLQTWRVGAARNCDLFVTPLSR